MQREKHATKYTVISLHFTSCHAMQTTKDKKKKTLVAFHQDALKYSRKVVQQDQTGMSTKKSIKLKNKQMPTAILSSLFKKKRLLLRVFVMLWPLLVKTNLSLFPFIIWLTR